MYAGKDFATSEAPIGIHETPIFTFNFAIYPLAVGETITSVVWSCTVADFASATDPSPSSRLDGISSIIGTQTLQQFAGMLDGVKYQIAAEATTSLGQVLELFSFALCQDRAKVT